MGYLVNLMITSKNLVGVVNDLQPELCYLVEISWYSLSSSNISASVKLYCKNTEFCCREEMLREFGEIPEKIVGSA